MKTSATAFLLAPLVALTSGCMGLGSRPAIPVAPESTYAAEKAQVLRLYSDPEMQLSAMQSLTVRTRADRLDQASTIALLGLQTGHFHAHTAPLIAEVEGTPLHLVPDAAQALAYLGVSTRPQQALNHPPTTRVRTVVDRYCRPITITDLRQGGSGSSADRVFEHAMKAACFAYAQGDEATASAEMGAATAAVLHARHRWPQELAPHADRGVAAGAYWFIDRADASGIALGALLEPGTARPDRR